MGSGKAADLILLHLCKVNSALHCGLSLFYKPRFQDVTAFGAPGPTGSKASTKTNPPESALLTAEDGASVIDLSF